MQTIALIPNSPALNSGSVKAVENILWDERGVNYHRIVRNNGIFTTDMGAFQHQPNSRRH